VAASGRADRRVEGNGGLGERAGAAKSSASEEQRGAWTDEITKPGDMGTRSSDARSAGCQAGLTLPRVIYSHAHPYEGHCSHGRLSDGR
jgi:hypothetical protein